MNNHFRNNNSNDRESRVPISAELAPIPTLSERFQGCLLGLAAGDAIGSTVEFKPRGSFPTEREMLGGGPFNLNPGEWTDDTSMALCLAASLLERKSFDPEDQMQKYLAWRSEGYMSSNGRCFDIGNTVAGALSSYSLTGNAFSGSESPDTSGNGSLMRLAPVVLFYFPDEARAIHFAIESSRTTHASRECLDACALFGLILCRALNGEAKDEVLRACEDLSLTSKIADIAAGLYRSKTEDQIKGSGYVVESLEAALWSFSVTNSFEEAISTAANLGDDADTTAAICGQLAGAFYGVSRIPLRWREFLAKRDSIIGMADGLLASNA